MFRLLRRTPYWLYFVIVVNASLWGGFLLGRGRLAAGVEICMIMVALPVLRYAAYFDAARRVPR